MGRFDVCLKFVLDREGRSDSEPAGDPNTSWGITQPIYTKWRVGRGLPEKDVDQATPDEITSIYAEVFWYPSRCDQLPAPLDLIHFDTAVNSGGPAAARMLQGALNMAVQDGIIGTKTVAAARAGDVIVHAARYLKLRINNYIVIAQTNTAKRPNLEGWLHRLGHLLLAV